MKDQLAIVFVLLLAGSHTVYGDMVTAEYETKFNGGSRAEGMITYDDSLPIVSGWSSGPTNGIEYLDVTFFDPGGNELLSVVDVTEAESSYFWLWVEFDTALQNFVPNSLFDIGADTGDFGEYYMAGYIGGDSTLFDVPFYNTVDSATSTSFAVTPVPEPTGLAMGAAWVLFGGLWRLRLSPPILQ